MQKIYNDIMILSQYSTKLNHVGFSVLYELEEVFNSVGIRSIQYRESASRFRNTRLGRKFIDAYTIEDHTFEHIEGKTNILILCLTPSFLRITRALKRFSNKIENIYVYFLDGFNPNNLDGIDLDLVKNVSAFFSIIEEHSEDFKAQQFAKCHYLPLAVNTSLYAPMTEERPIDVLSFGRTHPEHHKYLELAYGAADSEKIYVHSTFDHPYVFDENEHSRLRRKMMGRSKICLCFEASSVPRFHNRSPILYRWFESIAAGCVVVGSRPTCASSKSLLDWPNSTIDLQNSPKDTPSFLDELMADNNFLISLSMKNVTEARSRHDWRHRLYKLFKEINLEMPLSIERWKN